jgi:hypothetical protein
MRRVPPTGKAWGRGKTAKTGATDQAEPLAADPSTDFPPPTISERDENEQIAALVYVVNQQPARLTVGEVAVGLHAKTFRDRDTIKSALYELERFGLVRIEGDERLGEQFISPTQATLRFQRLTNAL